MDRIDLYLQSQSAKYYENTKREQEMIQKVAMLYTIAEGYKNGIEYVSSANLIKWRKAYRGTLNALDKKTGEESKRKSKQLRKMIYELIESKIDNSIPMPKITPRKKDDIPLVDITENYLKFEMDRMLSEQENDRSERATYIDGTSWYKIGWDSLDSTHDRSGDLHIEVLLADQVVPEPGVLNYKLMNYCFEISKISAARIYDTYGRLIVPTTNDNLCEIITYYYKDKNGTVSRFMYSPNSGQVISWDKDWQMRKLRTCSKCGNVVPTEEYCPNCGSIEFSYKNAVEEILEEDLLKIYNPYEAGESEDPNENAKEEVFLKAGSIIPFYQIRQLPLVPRLSISSLDSIYGISEVSILLDMQDSVNKILTKVEDKIMKSGVVVTKPHSMKLNDTDDTFKIMGVKTADEAAMVQAKQILADVSQDIASAQLFYESARASSGVTESFQGKRDNTATSGKAKEISAMQSAGRLESLRIMKSAACSGVYELALKYLMAFSDETRTFVKTLPDGKKEEMLWNKYMFLRKDKFGKIYYADDFAFSTDPAATLSNNRVQMWQETLQQFTMGTLGNTQDPRVLKLFWNVMAQMQYPLAKIVLASIEENEQHLPPELEMALLQNPELLQMAATLIEGQGEQRGGARPNSGPDGNGQTHAANVDKTNSRNTAQAERASTSNQAQMTGGNI